MFVPFIYDIFLPILLDFLYLSKGNISNAGVTLGRISRIIIFSRFWYGPVLWSALGITDLRDRPCHGF